MKQKGKIVNFIDICRYFPIYSFAEENQKHLKFFTDYQKLKKRGKDTPRQKNSLKENYFVQTIGVSPSSAKC